jgi:FkbM family methyltransferase
MPFETTISSAEIGSRLSSIFALARGVRAELTVDGSLEGSEIRPIVLFGAGSLAQMTLAHLRRVGIEPVAVADNNEKCWGTSLGGIQILSPREAVSRYGRAARFVVTIYNGSPVRRQLLQLGCAHVEHFADLYFAYPAQCLPYCGLAPREVVLGSWDQVVDASNVWHDEKSINEYLGQLTWRLRLPDCRLPPHDPPTDCYFPTNLYEYLEDEVLFDCGAYDGDSLRQYLSRRPINGSPRVLAFEPDADSFARLKEFVGRLPDSLATRIRIEPLAVAESTGVLQFSSLGSVRSGVAEGGGSKVSAIAIDDIDVSPTLIKMDVEGFELSALRGAATAIRRHLPVLAISLYHHASDLWTIPIFLKQLVPDYRLFLRRYAEDCWEVVLYAVPCSRMIGHSQSGL